MRLLQIIVFCLALWVCVCFCPINGQTGKRLLQRRDANAAPEPKPEAQPEAPAEPQPVLEAAAPTVANVSDAEDEDSAEEEIEASKQPLDTASIKSRAMDMNKGLCQEQSRYHPHFPKCQEYCKKLDHWLGQCWRMICHCYS